MAANCGLGSQHFQDPLATNDKNRVKINLAGQIDEKGRSSGLH